jgi:hypothetical protein
MEPPPTSSIVAVFIAPTWHDQARLRRWAKSLDGTEAFVLLTDEPSEGNTVLLRQARCSGVIAAVVRVPGLMRSPQELQWARSRRDEMMARVAGSIVDFGDVVGGQSRFPGKQTLVL